MYILATLLGSRTPPSTLVIRSSRLYAEPYEHTTTCTSSIFFLKQSQSLLDINIKTILVVFTEFYEVATA